MSLILNIDTATETAGISIAKDGILLASLLNEVQKDHAAFLHPAINQLLQTAKINIRDLDAIAVTAGPGSYTGIRVGMASAKGLCLSLQKPLIAINTLELLAKDAVMHYQSEEPHLFCPMIDARRMEVFTAVYDDALNEILSPRAMILEENSFADFASKYTLMYFGSGSAKWKGVVKLRNFIFIQSVNVPAAMAVLSQERFSMKDFTDVAYSEPVYLKEFYNG